MRYVGPILRRMRISSAYNFLVMLICVCMTFYAVYYFRDETTKEDNSKSPSPVAPREVYHRTNRSVKVIHLLSFPSYYELKMGGHHFKDCPISKCEYSDKPEAMSDSDAILFFTHHQTFKHPPEKNTGQVWIYFSVESPIHSSNSEFGGPGWENKFNWTMSYRLDSDIKFGYGDVVKGGVTQVKDYYKIAKTKKKLVAWFVSNCNTQSQRMKFVKLLQNYIPVDIYGNCGKLRCGRDRAGECRSMLERDYKFYLSFENSICQDYVTEKLLNILKLDIVPVARGGAKYNSILPTKMAVNTADFASVKDLAEYLKYLDNNIDQYVSYLKWKDSYHIVEPQPFPHCILCERLHHPEKWSNIYSNVAEWWSKVRCREAQDLKHFSDIGSR